MPTITLTHGWHVQQTADREVSQPRIPGLIPATVPGCIHSDLLAAGLIPEPFAGRNELEIQWIERAEWTYVLDFSAPEDFRQATHQELVFDGLDSVATVLLNGSVILTTDNMYQSHRVPVVGRLLPDGNRLEVRFGSPMAYIANHRQEFTTPKNFNDPQGNCERLRKQPSSFGWDWGPRFATSGIWQPVRLEAWDDARLETVHVVQRHTAEQVTLVLTPSLRTAGSGIRMRARACLEDFVVAQADGDGGTPLELMIPQPALWWPAGHGDQPLYEVRVELLTSEGKVVDRWKRRIGLRTVILDREDDGAGICGEDGRPLARFGFRVNGLLIFAKGANWVPVHAFVHGKGREDYAPPLIAARDAHMNCLRVWGGGIYEHEAFYDLCDELGLLVWQDFMFACGLYPGDPAFLASVDREARQQVARLQHRTCIGLWCGNNEAVMLNGPTLAQDPGRQDAYRALFHLLIPNIVAEVDGTRSYIPSSPDVPVTGVPITMSPSSDAHDWQVWHARKPVEHYLGTHHRFCSEFGMQSYPSVPVATTFCPPEELNAYSPTFENHQKNQGGNATIAEYCARQYRFPTGYAGLAYQSQANQAWCMQVAVEHFRRQQPNCLGALYWQLNDVWPVASWSSLEFGNRWKVLHHVARRFYAPVMLSAVRHGSEATTVGNYRQVTTGKVDLWLSVDAPGGSTGGRLDWELLDLDGTVRSRGSLNNITVERLGSRCLVSLDLTNEVTIHGRQRTYLRAWYQDVAGRTTETTVHFQALRFVDLKATPIRMTITPLNDRQVDVTLVATSHQHLVWLESASVMPGYSDNAVTLDAGRPRSIRLTFPVAPPTGWEDSLQVWSIAHTWQ